MKITSQFNLKTKYILKATLFCVVFTGLFVLVYFIISPVYEKSERITHAVIGTIVAFLITFIFLKFDKKKFADIGLSFEKTTFKNFVTGILMGIILMGVMLLSVIYFSNFKIEINKESSIIKFLLGTLPLLLLAFMEEVGFRAYPLSILKEKTGVRNAIIITSILFALYHIANGWTIQNSFLGAGVWGIVFGLAAVYSNGIAMPTGLHYAANLTTSAFGVSSSSSNIWILTQKDGSSLENYQSSQLETLIPQISLLVFGVICMEWYILKRKVR